MRTLVPPTIVLAATLLAGCGSAATSSTSTPPGSLPAATSDSATPTPSPTPGPTTGPGGCAVPAPKEPSDTGVSLITCVTVSGAVTAKFGFDDTLTGLNAQSCADYAKGTAATGAATHALQPPDPSAANVQVNGQNVQFTLAIGPYSGPGTFTSTTLQQGVQFGTTDYDNNFAQSSTFGATVAPDGSGTLTVTGLIPSTGQGSGSVSVSERWVCVPNRA